MDLGLKFVPSIFFNLNNFFLYYLFELDTSFTKLNSYIFFEKEKIRKNKTNISKKNYTFVETILNSLRYSNRTINHTNIPIQEETLLLRKNLLQTMTLAKKFKPVTNLTNKQISCIKKYFIERPFTLCNSDKNVGWVSLDKTLYVKLAEDHLFSNTDVYKHLDYNPLIETIEKINLSLIKLRDNGHISNRLYKQLIPKESCKLGKFRLLVKLHKKNFGIRPIINNIGHPTTGLSHFIDLFLQPFVCSSESYLKDSQNLIQICKDIQFDKKWYKYSCDFESLYTNINTTEAIQIITEHFSTRMTLRISSTF